MGYSDTTSNHFMCLHAGLSSFYGPSIMAGFGENGGLHETLKNSIQKTLFENKAIGQIKPSSEGWTNEMLYSKTKNKALGKTAESLVFQLVR